MSLGKSVTSGDEDRQKTSPTYQPKDCGRKWQQISKLAAYIRSIAEATQRAQDQDGDVGNDPSSFFLEAKGLSKDSQRTALLRHCAGQDVQDTLTDPGPVPEGDTEYAKAMRSLDSYFFPQVKNPFERLEFRQAKQDESETADQFVMKLFQLSEHCEFGEAKEEHIRDQLIDKCKSHNLRKKLLEAGGTLKRDCKINGSGGKASKTNRE